MHKNQVILLSYAQLLQEAVVGNAIVESQAPSSSSLIYICMGKDNKIKVSSAKEDIRYEHKHKHKLLQQLKYS